MSIPASPELSGSVRRISAMPPPKMAWKAAEKLEIPVTGFRERDLEQQARSVFGEAAAQAGRTIANLGRVMGPPWTADQKLATLAALLLLATERKPAAQRITR